MKADPDEFSPRLTTNTISEAQNEPPQDHGPLWLRRKVRDQQGMTAPLPQRIFFGVGKVYY